MQQSDLRSETSSFVFSSEVFCVSCSMKPVCRRIMKQIIRSNLLHVSTKCHGNKGHLKLIHSTNRNSRFAVLTNYRGKWGYICPFLDWSIKNCTSSNSLFLPRLLNLDLFGDSLHGIRVLKPINPEEIGEAQTNMDLCGQIIKV